jgi:hypothetical protein
MANELNILLDSGLTITAKVYNIVGTQQGTTVFMSEVVTSQYSGTFDVSSLADGVFPVHFYEGSVLVGSGSINVKGGTEVSLANLNDFNPATDTVANVMLVDTVTTNTDMRGTDGANTIPPDNASIAGILADTNELRGNQGDWITATGFATPANITDAQSAIISEINNLNNLSTVNIDDRLQAYDVATNAGVDASVAPLALKTTSDAIKAKVDTLPTDTEIANKILFNTPV